MKQRVLNIGIIEPSDLLFEGLTNILLKHNSNLKLYRIDDLEDLNRCIPNITFHVIVLNTILIQNRAKLFRNFKREYSEIRWIGIMNSLISTETLNEFNEIVRIDESSEDICRKIISIPGAGNNTSLPQKILSERETEVLKLLSKGLSNKEIADSLNISIHTVISHRKNLTQKTGIKSQSGLTIYALSNNIISLENL
ncbi:MAG: helix-turn-helix transcriptional regulator [Bacteroidales bacterium]|nr:helix-turn-helix transcriptional regulator [Bacteroidales bacterium]